MYLSRGLGDTSAVQSLISSLAPSYGVPSSLALALANQESGFNQAAVSPAGATGVMQLMPGTAAGLNVDPTDLTDNVQGGLTYLQQMYQKFGNWTQALEAYNAGPAGNLAASSAYANAILAAAGPLDSSSPDTGGLDTVASDISSDLSDVSGGLSAYAVAALAATALVLVWAVS